MDEGEILLDLSPSADDKVIQFSGTVCEQVRLDRMNRINKVVGVLFSFFELIMLAALIILVVYEDYYWLPEGIICLVLGAV